MPIALLALAAGGFGIGLTEFVIAGLLPRLASDLGVSASAAGWLISGYALSVAVGAIGVTALMLRFSRKRALLAMMVVFVLGNLLSAVAPGYGLLLAGRVLAALCHGAFFGIASMVAVGLVAPDRRGGALAIVFSGLTAANVLGVPLGTLLGEQYGWRSTFWAITVIGVIAFFGIAALVPADRGERAPVRLRGELRAFRSGQIWLSLIMTVLGFGGLFGAFSYIAFTLTRVSGFDPGVIPWLLLLFGAGMALGNVVGGKLANSVIDRTITGMLLGLTVVMALFALTASDALLAAVLLTLMGAFGFGSLPAVQARVMRYAGDAGTLASGANVSAANVGNALGAWIGGAAIAAGLGFTAPLWTGALISFAALVLSIVAARSTGRTPASAHLQRSSSSSSS
jgi:DHA1 family inner membrane transport protein